MKRSFWIAAALCAAASAAHAQTQTFQFGEGSAVPQGKGVQHARARSHDTKQTKHRAHAKKHLKHQ